MKPIHVGIMGVGTVGGGTATVLKRNAEEISRRAGRTIALKMAANLDVAKARELVGDDVEVVSDARLVATGHLLGHHGTLADMAIAPFVRQFAAIDSGWWAAQRPALPGVCPKFWTCPWKRRRMRMLPMPWARP